jgi:hypothetical protein
MGKTFISVDLSDEFFRALQCARANEQTERCYSHLSFFFFLTNSSNCRKLYLDVDMNRDASGHKHICSCTLKIVCCPRLRLACILAQMKQLNKSFC